MTNFGGNGRLTVNNKQKNIFRCQVNNLSFHGVARPKIVLFFLPWSQVDEKKHNQIQLIKSKSLTNVGFKIKEST